MRIDFHCHIFQSTGLNSLSALTNQFKEFNEYGFYQRMIKKVQAIKSIETDNIIDKTLYHAKQAQLDKIILLPLSINENEKVKEWAKYAPEVFIPFYNPPEKIEQVKSLGKTIDEVFTVENYKGIKVMLAFRKKFLNDKNLYPIWEIAERLDLPVLFHTGYPPPGTKKQVLSYANPIVLEEIFANFPKLKTIIAHMGFPFTDMAFSLAVQYPNVYLDISNLTYMMPTRLKAFIIDAKEIIGVHKILFGSDAFCPEMLEITINYFKNVDFLTDNEINKIVGLNAKKLLRL